ncbi:MAG: hypothetical protein GY871_19430 [Actinomycetales bacterium]|nr:hypothetical protein [Actinomycetales bacterium]
MTRALTADDDDDLGAVQAVGNSGGAGDEIIVTDGDDLSEVPSANQAAKSSAAESGAHAV